MTNILYEFIYLPLSWQISIAVGFLLSCILFRWPSVLVGIAVAYGLWLYAVDPVVMGLTLVVLVIVTVPVIRQYVLSFPIMSLAIKFKIFPKVSDTEKAALEAGSVWMDKELFSGDPNVKRLMSQKIQQLTPEELAFLHGPVAELCDMVDDWEIQKNKQIPDHVWAFIKEKKFLGMIIPKAHGGLGLSAIGHSVVIEKIASVSATLAITVMVPNSLGPAELLLHYGTQRQKDQYLTKLATGEEMPCFGLTEPTAGSDAGGLQSEGVVFKDDDGELKIRFNWNKRWITLSGISTVIGLAFLLKDPDQLLGGPKEYGITCALIPTHTSGVDVSKRHDPLGVPFMNCPTTGTNVVMPISCIIGEMDGLGKGWTMLMDCLSAGRGISLPSLSAGGAQAMVLATSSFGVIRQQFGMSVGQFEGIEEPMARVVGKTVLLKAARDYTCGAIDQGEKPSVISAILKLHSTEMFRDIVNDSMDILGGAGITQGPRNVTASAYKAAPIGITVEGANILTRTLIIFGQGALRCHPFAYDEVAAAETKDVKRFDRAFFGHIGHILRTTLRVVLLTLTQGGLSRHYGGFLAPYKRRLVWVSSIFALISDISMAYFGGALKAKQKITGRLGDVLSWMYLATSTMVYYEKHRDNKALEPMVQWALDYSFHNMQVALIGFFDNFSWVTRLFIAPIYRLWRVGTHPSDVLGKTVAVAIQADESLRGFLTNGVHFVTDDTPGIGKLNHTYKQIIQSEKAFKKIRRAVKKRQLPKKDVTFVLDDAVKLNIITAQEADQIRVAEKARLDAIQVDAFTNDEYLNNA
tara:strand:- start:11361 stop:13775 length:2415 start_codon:yes stop_codon:yes gene_type:complete